MIDKIDGRTPEEIKKGLKHCNSGSCDGCLYYDNCYSMCEMVCEKLNSDALAYIQRLEAERDAAVEELRRTHNCNICKHHKKSGGTCEGWSVCGYNIPNWEWRGVQEAKVDDR